MQGCMRQLCRQALASVTMPWGRARAPQLPPTTISAALHQRRHHPPLALCSSHRPVLQTPPPTMG